MVCKNCGTQNADGSTFCQGCGAKLGGSGSTGGTGNSGSYGGNGGGFGGSGSYGGNAGGFGNGSYNAPNNNYNNNMQAPGSGYIPEEYQPISMWGYFGYELLFSIPLVGFILLLVFSFGGTRNKNLRNFARSYFCFLILMIIIFGVILGGSIGAALSYM